MQACHAWQAGCTTSQLLCSGSLPLTCPSRYAVRSRQRWQLSMAHAQWCQRAAAQLHDACTPPCCCQSAGSGTPCPCARLQAAPGSDQLAAPFPAGAAFARSGGTHRHRTQFTSIMLRRGSQTPGHPALTGGARHRPMSCPVRVQPEGAWWPRRVPGSRWQLTSERGSRATRDAKVAAAASRVGA